MAWQGTLDCWPSMAISVCPCLCCTRVHMLDHTSLHCMDVQPLRFGIVPLIFMIVVPYSLILQIFGASLFATISVTNAIEEKVANVRNAGLKARNQMQNHL